jgi:hypothetical protein
MGIPVPLFWLRTFYVEFRWSPDEVHLESRYIEYKYANSSIFQVDSRWTPDGYWSPAGVHLNSVGECKVLSRASIRRTNKAKLSVTKVNGVQDSLSFYKRLYIYYLKKYIAQQMGSDS